MRKTNLNSGSISLFVLLFGVVGGLVTAGMVIFFAVQAGLADRRIVGEQAMEVAEAGINYYRWHLLHNPSDYTDGTGNPGPYRHVYTNTMGENVGEFELSISAPASANTVTVTSTGWLNGKSHIKKRIRAQFGNPSLARFAFLHNSNIWFGQGMTVQGPVLTNGGIRQDGVNTSTLQSSRSTYTCGVETGCEPSETKPAIWGNGGPQELWEYPISSVDFASIVIDFNQMKTSAQADGVYLPHSGAQGYHLVFAADGSLNIYVVNTTDFYKGWSYDYECQNLYQTIVSETLAGTYQVADAPIIFAEDTLWVEGTLNGKTTVVAARLPVNSYQQDIWIPNNLVYLNKSGDHKLGLISQRDIIFGKDVPDTFEVDGALLAQSSRVLRHHYNYHGCKQGNPGTKNELIIYGSVISNLISYWNFGGGGGGNPTSGFVKRTITYDPTLYFDPPPYFPSSGSIEMVSWNEEPAN